MLKTADTEWSLLGIDEVSSTTYCIDGSVGATHQSGIMLDGLLLQEQTRQLPCHSSLCNCEPSSLKETAYYAGRQVI